MKRCMELKNLVLQLYSALSQGSSTNLAEELFSKEQGFLAIGAGPGEWWQDSRIITEAYQVRLNAGRSEVTVTNMEAYQEGTAGWVVGRLVLKTPGGDIIPVRHTYIFTQENGEWKIIHAHYSLDVINEKF
jgi:hypothetical protein